MHTMKFSMLTVGCVVKTSDHPDVVTGEEQLAHTWIYYPNGENIESFDTSQWRTFTKINYGTH